MLLFCRDQYYDKKETDTTVRTHTPTPVPQRRFSRRNQSDDFRFTFGTNNITQVGGYPLLEREFEYHDLRRSVHRILRKSREANGFSAPEITIWEVVQKLLGCRRLSHANKYRCDPLLEKFFGIKGLPHDTTVGRYNKSFTPAENEKLANLNESVTDRVLSDARNQVRWHPQSGEENPFKQEGPVPMEVTLDVDGTGLTVYGEQEEAEPGYDFRKKDSPQYRLLSTFVGGLRLWLDSKLISGNYSLRGHGREMVTRASRRLPDFVEVGAVRGDSALYNGDDIETWVKEGKRVAISAQMQNNLREKIGALDQEDWHPFTDDDGEFDCEIAEISFAPSSWDHGPYRYIVSRREREIEKETEQKKMYDLDARYDYFAYVTNHEGSLLEAYRFTVGRCDVEKGVKESKIGFDGEEVPHDEYEGNRAYLGHVQLAYNLMVSTSINRLPAGASRYQRERFVRELIKIPARIIREEGGWVISLPDWWPYKKLARTVLKTNPPPG